MQEGCSKVPLSSIIVDLETKAEASICLNNFKEIMEDLFNEEFSGDVMILESDSMPLQTTSKRSPLKIKFGVQFTGASPFDDEEGAKVTYVYINIFMNQCS